MRTDKLQTVINRLMANDPNASWDECETLEEVAEGLRNAMEDYDETEETYQFYAKILSSILSQDCPCFGLRNCIDDCKNCKYSALA